MNEITRVFVAQEGPHDYTAAMKYGQVLFVCDREITPTPLTLSSKNAETIARIERVMTDYIPGHDYMIMTGSPIAIAHMLRAAFKRPIVDGMHCILKWDPRQQDYQLYQIP